MNDNEGRKHPNLTTNKSINKQLPLSSTHGQEDGLLAMGIFIFQKERTEFCACFLSRESDLFLGLISISIYLA